MDSPSLDIFTTRDDDTFTPTSQRLDTIHFNSTKTCNLSCLFCYDKSSRVKTDNLPLDIIALVANDAAALGARRVILSGGEPLTRTDWKDVALIFSTAGMEVSLATNGTLITKKTALFLRNLKSVSISISLDGGSSVHDELRQQKGAFNKTLQGMRFLHEAGLAFDVNATISKLNFSEVPTLTKIARDFRCTMRLSLLHPNGRGEAMEDKELTHEQIFELREYCHFLRKHAGLNIFTNLPPLLQYLDEIIPGRGAACGWAVNFCGILANGDVSICGVASDEPHLVAGNVKSMSFREIWLSSPLFKHTRSLNTKNLKGICGQCPFNEVCGGACRLSAYRKDADMMASYQLCQKFYNAGYIPDEILTPISVDDDRITV